ncbi:hypothetical protein IWX63_001285 [Arthrobacter sp. CAN_A2]
MRLTDKVEIWEPGPPTVDRYGNQVPGQYEYVSTVPANVSYQRVERESEPGRVDLIEELRAIIGPYDFDPTTTRLKWDGRMFYTDGPPMVRRRDGRTHHLTIPLRFV